MCESESDCPEKASKEKQPQISEHDEMRICNFLSYLPGFVMEQMTWHMSSWVEARCTRPGTPAWRNQLEDSGPGRSSPGWTRGGLNPKCPFPEWPSGQAHSANYFWFVQTAVETIDKKVKVGLVLDIADMKLQEHGQFTTGNDVLSQAWPSRRAPEYELLTPSALCNPIAWSSVARF